ncbi:MAG: alpha/beta fold hydrolase [Acidobacteriota bacterium]
MKRAVVVLTVLAVFPFAARSADSQAPAKTITVEDIYAEGSPVGTPPGGLTWSPDGRRLTYLDAGQLIEVDPSTGRPRVLIDRAKMAPLNEAGGTEEEKANRLRYGMSSYIWTPDSRNLLFNSAGRLWLFDLRSGTGVQIGDTNSEAGGDPKFSPDGRYVSFIRDHGLFAVALHEPGVPTIPLAPVPSPATTGQDLINGGVDWVYEEELEVRSNYFWSPDSKYIAYLQMNETNVPQYPITDWIPTHAQVEMQRYPQPGDPNPDAHLGIVSVRGGRTDWFRIPFEPGNDYLPRFGWADNRTLWIETVSRDHKHRRLLFADAPTQQWRDELEIDDDKFVDDNYDVTVDDGYIVLTAWTSGTNQVYLYSYDPKHPGAHGAKLVKQLTSGDFDVSAVYRVDVKNKKIYYASNEGNPLEQQIWEVSFDGARKRLSSGAGFHDGTFAPAGTAYADAVSTRMQPPRYELCPNTGQGAAGRCTTFWETHALDSWHLRAPEPVQVKAKDGETLYGTLLLPAGKTAAASVPLIVNPYGGPGPQEVADRWSNGLLFDELLAQHGFAVLHADNRGTGNRGRKFAQYAYRDFGPVQLQDQLTVIDAVLRDYPQLDAQRMGWWGWSWGGSFTLYAMTHSDRFRAGVAVAPVTDWRDYDSIYTERYLGLPTQDSDVYRDDSVVNSAARLKGHLLLVQGTGDDNVHMENTVQFIQQLVAARIPYDLQIYPRKTHSIAGADARTHLFERILAQFERYLGPGAAAEGAK